MGAFWRPHKFDTHRSDSLEMEVHAELYDMTVIADVFTFGIAVTIEIQAFIFEFHIVVFGFDGNIIGQHMLETGTND